MSGETGTLTLEGLARRLEALEQENAGLREKVAALTKSSTNGESGAAVAREPAAASEAAVSRRALLTKAGAAVVAVGAGVLLTPREAKAARLVGDGNPGVRGIGTVNDARGVLGEIQSGLTGDGVQGFGRGIDRNGVYGQNNGQKGIGVHGQALGPGGVGVIGDGPSGTGVFGGSGTGTGVGGTSNSGHGVRGEVISGTVAAVHGSNDNAGGNGVSGQAFGTDGVGVIGYAGRGSGAGVVGRGPTGVRGVGFGANAGVFGRNDDAGGYGVYGGGVGSGGAGVYGINTSGPGMRAVGQVGVQGVGFGANGYGGQFEGARAQVRLVPGTGTGRPTTGNHAKGEFYMDSAATLWVCTVGGTPGTWRRVTTSA